MNEHSDTVPITRRDQSRFPEPKSRKFSPHQVSVLTINFIGDELNGFVFIAQQLCDVIVLRKTTVFDINKEKDEVRLINGSQRLSGHMFVDALLLSR